MSEAPADNNNQPATDESTVIEYLRHNPELLMQYPELFAALSVPHGTAGATSLVERQVKILRNENQKLKQNIEQLVSIARDNEDLNQRFHRLALELINSDQLHDVLALVQDQVQTFFYTDYVCFRFLPGVSAGGDLLEELTISDDEALLPRLTGWIRERQPVCGPQPREICDELFGPDMPIGSCALIPLYGTSDFGLLCLASTDRARFTDEMGTIFLQQLGELVSSRLNPLLHRHN
jgi:uncharacterized protein YigA (DUF484 family)